MSKYLRTLLITFVSVFLLVVQFASVSAANVVTQATEETGGPSGLALLLLLLGLFVVTIAGGLMMNRSGADSEE